VENWTPAEVIGVIGALGTLITLLGKTIVDIILTAKTRKEIKGVKDDLAANTQITKEGTASATENAKLAADTATEAKDTAKAVSQDIKDKLNGGLDSAIEQLVRPIFQAHDARIATLERDMAAIKASVEGVSRNVDSTRHEMRGHLQAVTNKLDLIGTQLPKKDG
jgi:hypothetical protein